MAEVIKPFRGAMVDMSHPQMIGCVAWWLFGDGSGSIVQDVVGDADGTMENMTPSAAWVPGRSGYVLQFDGVNDRVRTFKQYQPNNFTAMIRFRSTAASPHAFERLMDKRFTDGFWIGRNDATADSWGGGVWEPSAPYGRFITLEDGVWHHIVSRRRDTTHTIIGDGGATSVSGVVLPNTIGPDFFFFGDNHLQDTRFEGQLEDARFYDKALSNEMINYIYHRPWDAIMGWGELTYDPPLPLQALGGGGGVDGPKLVAGSNRQRRRAGLFIPVH